MNFRVLLATALILIMAPFGHAQTSYLAPAGTDNSNRIETLELLLNDDPESLELNLELANLNCSVGNVRPCQKYVDRVIDLAPDSAEELRARHALMFCFYTAGRIFDSWEIATAIVEKNPGAQPALSFLTLIEAGRDSYWNGEIPKQISWYGYDTANELISAIQQGGAGLKGLVNDGQSDCVILRNGRQICWESVSNWTIRQNTLLNNGTRALLMYTENKAQMIPSIGITVDNVAPDTESTVAYANQVAEALAASEGVVIKSISPVKQKQWEGALLKLDMPKGIRSVWYQFLFDNQIVSLQLLTTIDSVDKHSNILDEMIKSMEIGAPVGPIGSFRPPANQ